MRAKWVIVAGGVGVLALVVWLGYFGRKPAPRPPVETPHGLPRFEDVTTRVGVAFRHFDPATPQHLLPETMGSGLAWIDYDADGWLDIFCVQDGPLPPAKVDPAPTHKLYRNTANGSFQDVTEVVGLNVTGFGTGVAVGDFDNDGFDDLVVTYLHDTRLFQNRPDGKGGRHFDDITATANLSNPHYATSCGWGDIDGDGFLDLYICNYVEIDRAKPVMCKHPDRGTMFQCAPTAFPLARHVLFRNNRNGTFTDVTQSSGVADAALAPGLAVALLDLDADGKLDIYVANDLHPAYLFHNKGGGTFDEIALSSGCGLTAGGGRIAGMCAEAADVDGSGWPSLFVTNYQNSPNTLFRNRGNGRFTDIATASGLGPPSLNRLGFGAVFLDADLDGTPDLAVANGHVQRIARELYGVQYAQEAQLFLNDGKGVFRDASATAGPDFLRPRVGRGLARCDFDNDGRPDVAMSGVGESVAVLRNMIDTPNNWISLELIGDGIASNRNAIGAKVKVEWAGGVHTHFIVGGGSYLSASDRRLALGLGTAAQLDRVTVTWPSGKVQEFQNLAAKSFWRLQEGVPALRRFR